MVWPVIRHPGNATQLYIIMFVLVLVGKKTTVFNNSIMGNTIVSIISIFAYKISTLNIKTATLGSRPPNAFSLPACWGRKPHLCYSP